MQAGEFSEYQSEFMKLSHHVDGLSEEFLVICFISGLKKELRYELLMKAPPTVAVAIRLAKLEEKKLAAVRRNARVPSKHPNSSTNSNRTATSSTSASGSSSPQIKKYSPQEIRERGEKGLCFYCDEKYSRGHNCRNQKLFQIEISVDEEEWSFEKEEPTIELSAHSMRGITG